MPAAHAAPAPLNPAHEAECCERDEAEGVWPPVMDYPANFAPPFARIPDEDPLPF